MTRPKKIGSTPRLIISFRFPFEMKNRFPILLGTPVVEKSRIKNEYPNLDRN